MLKFSQLSGIFDGAPQGLGRVPAFTDPANPLVQGGNLPQYNHLTTSAIPKQHTNIPSGIAQITNNPIANTILSTVIPMAARPMGINIAPSLDLSNMDPITAGEATTFTLPAYTQHMQGQQQRAARTTAQAITNSIDPNVMRRINPKWNKVYSQRKLESLLEGPVGGMLLSQAPQGSPIHTMMDPKNQLFNIQQYMSKGDYLPKKAQAISKDNKNTFSSLSKGNRVKSTGEVVKSKPMKPLPVPGTPGSLKETVNGALL